MIKRFSDASIQSTGAFMMGELERFDKTLYEPIADYTWSRDIKLREDVTVADEATSFALVDYAYGAGGAGIGQKAWATQEGNAIPSVGLSVNKQILPVTPWAMKVGYTVIELEKAQMLGRPVDRLKYDAMRTKHQRDIDEQVYIGDKAVGVKGLVNHDDVARTNVGAIGSINTPEALLDVVNNLLNETYKNTQYQRVASSILLPASLAPLFSKPMTLGSMGGFMTVAEWIRQQSLCKTIAGKELTVNFCRWLDKDALGESQGRIVVYENAQDIVRFPLVQLQNTPVQFRDLSQETVYYGALGAVEVVRPELIVYGDLK